MFKKVEKPMQAYLKAGIFGFAGAGKTWTATDIAIGLHEYAKSTKGVLFVDTENGSDFMIPRLKEKGIEVYTDKTRTFADLLKDMDAAPDVADILIIDSISHFWREMVTAYKGNRTFLRIQDWGPLKEKWAQYTTRYVNSPLHIIMCGRAANVFEDVQEEKDNPNAPKTFKAVRVGTKMSAETETGYEPSLLIEMEKVMLGEGGRYARRANVIKDRYGVIDSQEFDFAPTDKEGYTFECFLPHIKRLNIGGEHTGIDLSRTSASMFDRENDGDSWGRFQKRREIEIEEIKALFDRKMPGQSAKEKKLRAEMSLVVFGTGSAAAIGEMHPDKLNAGRGLMAFLLDEIEKGDGPSEGVDSLEWIRGLAKGYRVPDSDPEPPNETPRTEPTAAPDAIPEQPTLMDAVKPAEEGRKRITKIGLGHVLEGTKNWGAPLMDEFLERFQVSKPESLMADQYREAIAFIDERNAVPA